MTRTLRVVVRELKPELLDDYFRFFDQAFSDFPHWAGCYCGFYDTHGDTWDPTAKAGPEHRAARSELIRTGRARGLLAYAEEKPVGWCNAQSRASFANMRQYKTAVDNPNEPVGSIMCFLVHPDYRAKGIGTALLNAACDKFKRDGLRVAEGYPTTSPAKRSWEVRWAEENYKGSLNMYLKNGFKLHRQLERFAIVRKQL